MASRSISVTRMTCVMSFALSQLVFLCQEAAIAQSVAPGTGRYTRRIQVPEHALALINEYRQVSETRRLLLSHPEFNVQNACNELLYVVRHAQDVVTVESGRAGRSSAMLSLGTASSKLTSASTTLNNCGGDRAQQLLALEGAAENARSAATDIIRAAQDDAEPTSWILPTVLKCDINPHTKKCDLGLLGSDMAVTNSYFNSDIPLTVAGKVKYNYTGADTISSISGDLLALQFPYVGFQIALGANATSKPSTTQPTTPAPSTAPTAASIQEAIQKLEQGGDFYLRWTLPLIYTASTRSVQVQAFTTSLFGFELPGGGLQNTISKASHGNGNVASELYAQWDSFPFISPALPSAGRLTDSTASAYVDLRYGWQSLSKSQAGNAALGNNTSYRLGQLGLGVVLKGYGQISAQKYWGPEQAFMDASGNPVTVNNFKKWQVSVQITPAIAAAKQ
jgi:hypothetical protein